MPSGFRCFKGRRLIYSIFFSCSEFDAFSQSHVDMARARARPEVLPARQAQMIFLLPLVLQVGQMMPLAKSDQCVFHFSARQKAHFVNGYVAARQIMSAAGSWLAYRYRTLSPSLFLFSAQYWDDDFSQNMVARKLYWHYRDALMPISTVSDEVVDWWRYFLERDAEPSFRWPFRKCPRGFYRVTA